MPEPEGQIRSRDLKKKISASKIKHIKEKLFKEDAQFLMHGDKPTKAFFDKYKNKKKSKYIKALKNELGESVDTVSGMLKIAEKFYRDLYSGGNSRIHESTMDFFLNHICQTIKNVNNKFFEELMQPITVEEIYEVIMELFNGRTPGPDGISNEFYKVMFPVIKEELVELFNFYLNNGRILSKIKEGLVVLIPKEGSFDDITNYRPITLLNSDYKIFCKILSNRLQPILKEVIHVSQFAQPGRDINEMNCVIRGTRS